ncbi:MAG TPA: hypothetical protein PKL13_02165 [bacterium]|nr:hypothetical protein [bacterium]
MEKKDNSKPKWCSLNIKKISECMFEGICLANGVCSFKKQNRCGEKIKSPKKQKRNPRSGFQAPKNSRKH